MESKLRKQLQQLLSEPDREADPAAFNKAKTLYRSCVNTTRLEERGLEPARKILEVAGGWPLLENDSWDESKFDWQQTLYAFEEMGISSEYFLFNVAVSVDAKNATKHITHISPPVFHLNVKPLDIKSQLVHIKKFVDQLKASALLLAEPNSTRTNASLIEIESRLAIGFEVALNRHTKSLEDGHNLMNNLNMMNVTTLQKEYPYVPWMEYLSRTLPPSVNLTEAEMIVVEDPGYLKGLGAELAKVPKRTLANFMVWRALQDSALPYMTKQARKNVGEDQDDRPDSCVKLVQHQLRMATAAMYVRRFFSEEARKKAREMALDVSKEMYRLLESVDWMDPTTRRSAMMKAEVMGYHIGFPDELLNDTVLDDHYSWVELDEGRLMENVMALDKESNRRSREKLRTRVKKSDWTYMTGFADVVNAYYAHGENSLSIPAGILQGAFFQKDRPQYMNYGAIGFAIGHEVSHGFDETGGLFNMNGLMENWWEEETRKRFDEKVRCIVDLYSTLKSEELNVTVNGVLTQSENIADNAALKLAYQAYRRYTSRHGQEPRVVIPTTVHPSETPTEGVGKPAVPTPTSISLKPKQMFWLSFASVWCGKNSKAELNRKLRTSSHLPGQYRVNGAVRNQAAFAADFNCPLGTPMNPIHKCEVW
ncbi:neprilysin-2 [Frankliniella occidentalis]|uniref:Neprilysin-2 n=1 Tax=Frankliniella occidentalis TaxID=133901 RepID=A0A6J1SNB8_FRAOC|nr:neprilysin-2 [Frankliniella occidentalis]